MKLDAIDQRVLVDRPGVRGSLPQRLAIGLAGSPDVPPGDRRERDQLYGVDLDLTGADSVAAALLDPRPRPQPDRERDVSGQDVVAQLPAEFHNRDASGAYGGRVVRIRHAAAGEAELLEGLQRRSSDVWEEYREQLAAHPDAIELPETLINQGLVRVAVTDDDAPVGFSVVIPTDDHVHELDGLFVEPTHMGCGVGRSLVEDAAAGAVHAGAERLEVTAGPAQGFYEKVGFQVEGTTQTRFGPAIRMRRSLPG